MSRIAQCQISLAVEVEGSESGNIKCYTTKVVLLYLAPQMEDQDHLTTALIEIRLMP